MNFKLRFCKSYFTVILFFATNLLFSQQNAIQVANEDELIFALKKIKGNDIIEILPGEFNLNAKIDITLITTKDKPAIIRAKNPGTVKFIGNTWFSFKNSSFISIEGIEFLSNDGPAVELLGCNNIRVTNNVFHLKETKKSSWIFIGNEEGAKSNTSHHNRIDHNLFENKKELGNFITIEGTMAPEFQVSQYDLIDNNYFRNIGPRAENVLEAIRVGSSHVSLSSGFTVIEKNLFERCDGDPEVVSIKSSDDTVRYNTFRECLGVLSLRHGNRSTVDGNFFFGNGRTGEFVDNLNKKWNIGTGGVRLCGDNMKITNNYFEGLTGVNWDASLALTNGDADYGMGFPLTKHFRSRYILVAYNTFVNNKSNIEIGYDGGGFQNNWWKLPPGEITIANNIVLGKEGKLIDIITAPINSLFMGNYLFPQNNAVIGSNFLDDEVKVVNPKLEKVGEVWTLSKNSPLRKKSVGKFPVVNKDIHEQVRSVKTDPGCDEINTSQKTNKPLTKGDVGPNWYKVKL
jgi:hypothetical protein